MQQAISSFLTMFSTLCGTYFLFQMHFKMSFAICFNLDQSKILSSGNGLKGFCYIDILTLPNMQQGLIISTVYQMTLEEKPLNSFPNKPWFLHVCSAIF